MPGYLDQIKQLAQGKANESVNKTGSPQFYLGYEIDEINEVRDTLLGRLRTGQEWLLAQHQRWQNGDTTAADDEAFSRAWNLWWDLDWRLRADHGLAGCIHGVGEKCPESFGCIGCGDVPAPSVVAQLELSEMSA